MRGRAFTIQHFRGPGSLGGHSGSRLAPRAASPLVHSLIDELLVSLPVHSAPDLPSSGPGCMAFSFELKNDFSALSGAAAYSGSGSGLRRKANINQGQLGATELSPPSQCVKSSRQMVTDARTRFMPLLPPFPGED